MQNSAKLPHANKLWCLADSQLVAVRRLTGVQYWTREQETPTVTWASLRTLTATPSLKNVEPSRPLYRIESSARCRTRFLMPNFLAHPKDWALFSRTVISSSWAYTVSSQLIISQRNVPTSDPFTTVLTGRAACWKRCGKGEGLRRSYFFVTCSCACV